VSGSEDAANLTPPSRFNPHPPITAGENSALFLMVQPLTVNPAPATIVPTAAGTIRPATAAGTIRPTPAAIVPATIAVIPTAAAGTIYPTPAAIVPATIAVIPTAAGTIRPTFAAIVPTTIAIHPTPATIVPGFRVSGYTSQDKPANHGWRPLAEANEKFSSAQRRIVGAFFLIGLEIFAHGKASH
jgi:hypothetical protein